MPALSGCALKMLAAAYTEWSSYHPCTISYQPHTIMHMQVSCGCPVEFCCPARLGLHIVGRMSRQVLNYTHDYLQAFPAHQLGRYRHAQADVTHGPAVSLQESVMMQTSDGIRSGFSQALSGIEHLRCPLAPMASALTGIRLARIPLQMQVIHRIHVHDHLHHHDSIFASGMAV